jgi:hypothetical protein
MSSHKVLICGIPKVMEKLIIEIDTHGESHESKKGFGIGLEIVSEICVVVKVGVCEGAASFVSGISMEGSSGCISGGSSGNSS